MNYRAYREEQYILKQRKKQKEQKKTREQKGKIFHSGCVKVWRASVGLSAEELEIKACLTKYKKKGKEARKLEGEIQAFYGVRGSSLSGLGERGSKSRGDISDVLVGLERKKERLLEIYKEIQEGIDLLYSLLCRGLTPGQYDYLVDNYFYIVLHRGDDKKAIRALTAAMKRHNRVFPIQKEPADNTPAG
ncbi:hypothetical protein [uncultured Veillonella sp.]|uniref:hypothetical protein n=1 Tax=uncultured Veillonella sp. TaxID=159268 RepID=UPI002591F1B3|nr:hypothetical protein [uncultured Veillonella sp.]